MLKRLFFPLSLVNQLVLILLLLAALGSAGLALASWLGQSIQGNAHAINTAGTLRMQSYRLLAAVPLQPKDARLLREMNETASSDILVTAARRDNQQTQLEGIQDYWRDELAPALQQATARDQVEQRVDNYVRQIDALVTTFDHTTELRMQRVIWLQQAMAAITALLLVFTIFWLRRRLLSPWQELLGLAKAIGQRDFSRRAEIPGRNEMALLGSAFNSMAGELAESYGMLEQRVAEKTAGLAVKNQIVSFLYQANQRFHSAAPLSERFIPVLNDLQRLTPLCDVALRIYEHEDEARYEEFTLLPDSQCNLKSCETCARQSQADTAVDPPLTWRLADHHQQYGLLIACLPEGARLNADHQQLMDALAEQLTTALALSRQQQRQQQLVVLEERNAIARELHDSIAQSLSCLKMQVSCLQMQGEALPADSRVLLQQMRNELNTSWRQLRELLTTFRLQLTEPGLRPALEASCQEFSAKMGIPVTLNYQLPPRLVPTHQAIHAVQIAREALNNSFKHAHASEAGIDAHLAGDLVTLTIWDNGQGIREPTIPGNHYGLVIMRDRARSLHGQCLVASRPAGGTEVRVMFVPQAANPFVTGETL